MTERSPYPSLGSQHSALLPTVDKPEPCCEYGPTGHTEQQHHDASPCYDQSCPLDHPHGGPFPHPCDRRHPHSCRCDNCQHDAMTEQESQR